MVAVTGDENSGTVTSADPAGPDSGVSPADSAGTSPAEAVDMPAADSAGTPPATTGADAAMADAAGADADAGADAAADADAAAGQDEAASSKPSLAELEQESEIAADYIEGLLDVADLDGDIDMDVESDRPVVSVVGATLDELVGSKGEVLEALQELTRLAVHRQTGTRSRIMLDMSGYRARRREELNVVGQNTAEEVSRTGVARRLEAMTPFERKIVHDAVAAAGLRSESEGEEPDRRVVVFPAG